MECPLLGEDIPSIRRILMAKDSEPSGIGKTYDEIWEDFRKDRRFASLTEHELLQIHRKWMNLGKLYFGK